MIGDTSFTITPRRGEYQLLDKETGDLVDHTIFRTPTKMGKGVLAVKTVDGNILLGPTSEDIEDKQNTAVTAAGLETVATKETEFFDHVPLQMAITQFTGLRAHGDKGDFIINSPRENFLNFAGIESPGLTSAPAIGLLAEALLFGAEACPAGAALANRAGLAVPLLAPDTLDGQVKADWKPQRTETLSFRTLSLEEKNQWIQKEPAYGRVICRCEEVTEGEILAEIRRNPPAKDIDAVKRRTRAGMGRCQGGFCLPAVCEILAKEWGVPLTAVTKRDGGSYILTGRTKGTETKQSSAHTRRGCRRDRAAAALVRGRGGVYISREKRERRCKQMKYADVAIIGGGPAGMAAALAAREAGAGKVVILERDARLGGILEQCIHNGFGLHRFHEELTGPEYAERYEQMVQAQGITCLCNTMVVDLTQDRRITAVNQVDGYFQIEAKAVVLAMGCREKPRGALATPGTRPAGVMTAGTAQKFVNLQGYLPGREIVILGSGDIGLIMARRMSLEGAKVKAVCEIMQDSGGLTRNIVQCLQDYDIPLLLSHTVTEIHGKERVTGVTISEVDAKLQPIAGTARCISCDTLMLSVGLIPENEISKKAGIAIDAKTKGPIVDEARQTSVRGIFACGNVVKVHELVDFVSAEGARAGAAAAAFALGAAEQNQNACGTASVIDHENLPFRSQEKQTDETTKRETKKPSQEQKKGVKPLQTQPEEGKVVICTVCPMGCRITVDADGMTQGNTCKRGEVYARQEVTEPKRTLTSTIATTDGRFVPVQDRSRDPAEAGA